eukprot:COSAG06_NODE_23930_length_677_cov_1.370242_1_plen_143_part_10
MAATKSSQLIRAMMRTRASGCTVTYLAQGACRAPKTGGARLTEALKAATCSSTFAHAHRGSGMRCSSTQKSAGPAGRRALRKARAAPDRSPAELLDNLPAPASTGIVIRKKRSLKLTGCRAAQPENDQVQPEPHEARAGRPDR